jgi:hypothetical protein
MKYSGRVVFFPSGSHNHQHLHPDATSEVVARTSLTVPRLL